MIRIPGKIPITIYTSFWIMAAVIAVLLGQADMIKTVIWVPVILISVLFHELGHALTALLFGRNPRIELVAMGGLTYHDGDKLPFWKQFFITLNGPVFGFIIVVGVYLLKEIPAFSAAQILEQILLVNIFWTMVNLLPILPLDGGQLLRLILEKLFVHKGIRYAFMWSAILSLGCCLLLFLTQNLLMGAIFFLFAFENFDNFRKSRFVSESDQCDEFKKTFLEAEMNLRQGNKERALTAFESLRVSTKQGLLYDSATQYAAFLHYDQGHLQEAYQLLISLKNRLDPDALALLHRIAFEQSDYSMVMELAGSVFQYCPEAEVALRSAYAAASLKLAEASIGWLQTARQSGVENLKEIVLEKNFDPIRGDPAFESFVSSL
ncbi:MAG TPA: M50 family metallopeptidase [Rhabdochlamydiaceae bacterium]|jgi:Zn-dependent protease|nr:M50 family metallopeptidase [Rhabdochlamydiaceae bacterium]